MKPYSLYDISGCFSHGTPEGARRIAWDGVSFCVPSNWELAVYKSLKRGAMRIEMEDEYSVRLESEWVRGRRKLNLKSIMKRYEKASKPLTVKSEGRNDIAGLPDGWHATHFLFRESGADAAGGGLQVVQHELVTAFYLCPKSSVFCFFLLHFMPGDRESPADVIRQIAGTFEDHVEQALIPWQLFDIAFKLPREFKLEKTQFDIGVKLMAFTWRHRRYFLWHFSCPDIFLEGAAPAEWACGFLNAARLMKAPVFYPEGQGGIKWRRRRPYLFGHREEIAALCYRYDVGCRLLHEENKLLVWAYNYRRTSDLEFLPQHDVSDG